MKMINKIEFIHNNQTYIVIAGGCAKCYFVVDCFCNLDDFCPLNPNEGFKLK